MPFPIPFLKHAFFGNFDAFGQGLVTIYKSCRTTKVSIAEKIKGAHSLNWRIAINIISFSDTALAMFFSRRTKGTLSWIYNLY
jgi:hypothetical protein